MKRSWNRILQSATALTAAGVLPQTAGCDASGLLNEWVVLVANELFTSFFYDLIQVPQPFVF